ncbi:hypothetical protein ACU4GR_33870 (plasmid) [Methylobacterium oryzae CBMB20]
MIPARDTWGPFAPGLDPAEYRARLRCLRAVVRLTTGPRGEALTHHLRRAETDPAALPLALAALNRLAGLDLRHVVASYAALNRVAA